MKRAHLLSAGALAIGIALVNTWLIDLTRVHAAQLSADMGERPERAREMVQGLTQYAQGWTTDAADALRIAEAMMGRVAFDLTDSALFSNEATTSGRKAKVLAVTVTWAALNAAAIVADRRR